MGRKLLNLLPMLAFLATFGVFLVDKNRAARTIFGSGRGLLTVAVIIAGYVSIAFVLPRFVKYGWVAPVALTGVVLVLAAWIVRPYYVDETANRELVTGPIADAPSTTATTAAPDPTDAPGTTSPPTTATPTAVRIARGDFAGIDHDASGSVSLIQTAEGSLVVRFEDFDIEGVPDPVVYLVEGEDVQDDGGANLGGLPGNQGDVLDFSVPGGTNAGPGWTLLVWCRAFGVPVANATLT